MAFRMSRLTIALSTCSVRVLPLACLAPLYACDEATAINALFSVSSSPWPLLFSRYAMMSRQVDGGKNVL